jgi:hypothetical protein
VTVYRQWAHKLRLEYGPGVPHVESERPFRERLDGSIQYLDSDEAPTLITLTGDEVNIIGGAEWLIGIGAITLAAPHAVRPAKAKETDSGETAG